jgi:uncharacterized phage infection (PIP) family protein YhgE
VVAEQVRTLAQRSAEAAKQTSRLIEESVESAEQGASIERAVATELSGVATQVHKVGSVLTDVADACGRQRDDIGQVTRAFSELNGTTQQAAATAEESASAAEELAGRATMLTEMVSTFHLSHRAAATAKLAHRPSSHHGLSSDGQAILGLVRVDRQARPSDRDDRSTRVEASQVSRVARNDDVASFSSDDDDRRIDYVSRARSAAQLPGST